MQRYKNNFNYNVHQLTLITIDADCSIFFTNSVTESKLFCIIKCRKLKMKIKNDKKKFYYAP